MTLDEWLATVLRHALAVKAQFSSVSLGLLKVEDSTEVNP